MSAKPTRRTPLKGTAHNPRLDTDLLELCARFHKQAAAAAATEEWDADGLAAALDVRHDIADQIEEISAVTATGMRAKAQVAVFWLEESRGPDFSNSFSRGSAELWFALEALRDMQGGPRNDQHHPLQASCRRYSQPRTGPT